MPLIKLAFAQSHHQHYLEETTIPHSQNHVFIHVSTLFLCQNLLKNHAATKSYRTCSLDALFRNLFEVLKQSVFLCLNHLISLGDHFQFLDTTMKGKKGHKQCMFRFIREVQVHAS